MRPRLFPSERKKVLGIGESEHARTVEEQLPTVKSRLPEPRWQQLTWATETEPSLDRPCGHASSRGLRLFESGKNLELSPTLLFVSSLLESSRQLVMWLGTLGFQGSCLAQGDYRSTRVAL